jgi:ATP-dependent 26S proteasome regulatory subunit
VDDAKEVMKVWLQKMPIGECVGDEVAPKIRIGRTRADIDSICREAALVAHQDSSDIVSTEHFLTVINKLYSLFPTAPSPARKAIRAR